MADRVGEGERAAERVAHDRHRTKVERPHEACQVIHPTLHRVLETLRGGGVAEPDDVGRDAARGCPEIVGRFSRQFAQADTPGPEPWMNSTGEPSPMSW